MHIHSLMKDFIDTLRHAYILKKHTFASQINKVRTVTKILKIK